MLACGRPGGGIDLQDIRTGKAHAGLVPGDTTVKATCLTLSPECCAYPLLLPKMRRPPPPLRPFGYSNRFREFNLF